MEEYILLQTNLEEIGSGIKKLLIGIGVLNRNLLLIIEHNLLLFSKRKIIGKQKLHISCSCYLIFFHQKNHRPPLNSGKKRNLNCLNPLMYSMGS